MNNSRSSLGETSSLSSKPTHICNKDKSAVDDTIAINEKINLTESSQLLERDFILTLGGVYIVSSNLIRLQ
jgi:hypothetical protein